MTRAAERLILDLFCCAGGMSVGLGRAGFRVVGNDMDLRGEYPFPVRAGDALGVLDGLLAGDAVGFTLDGKRERLGLEDFAAATGSPPCQGVGAIANGNQPELQAKYPDLIGPVRERFERTGLPCIIENVPQSSVRPDLVLCGDMFDLGVIMHRHFELVNWTTPALPPHPRGRYQGHKGYVRGWRHRVYREGPYVQAYGKGGGKATVEEMQAAKGIDWTDEHLALREAIPPAYGEFIGERLHAWLDAGSVVRMLPAQQAIELPEVECLQVGTHGVY